MAFTDRDNIRVIESDEEILACDVSNEALERAARYFAISIISAVASMTILGIKWASVFGLAANTCCTRSAKPQSATSPAIVSLL